MRVSLFAALLVSSLGCHRTETRARALDAELAPTGDAARDVVTDIGPTLDAALDDAPLHGSVDGNYRFREQCPGASETTWIFDVHGAEGELFGPSAERVRLRAMPEKDGNARAFIALRGTSLAPLFRVAPEGFVLRLIAVDDAGWFGSFRPACTAPGDVVFLESKGEALHDWAPRAFAALKLRYPRKLFTVTETPRSLELLSPDVFGEGMNGGRFPFRVRIAVHELPVLGVLKKEIASSFGGLFPAGTAASFEPSKGFAERTSVGGRSGYRIRMGIEGTNTRTDYVELAPARTLAFAVDYATDFANPKIKMSAFEQLAIADVILRSLQL